MIALNYAKKVIGGYVLNFYADSYKEVVKFPVNSSYKTYGIPFPGSVITVVENGIKTNYILTADRKWIELSLNNYVQLETVEKLPTENISTNVIYKVEDNTSVINNNYIFGQKFDIITSDNIGIITPQITNIVKTHGIPADDADSVTELCTIIACINYYYNTNNKSYDVNMYDNGEYVYKSTTLSDIGIGSPIDEKFNTIEELYNFINKTIDDILKNPNIDESVKEGFKLLDKYSLEYKYTNEPLNDSNLFLNVVEGPVYKYYLYNGLSYIEVGGSNEGSDAPFITLDITGGATGILTDEQLTTLSADNAYIKFVYSTLANPITFTLNKTGIVKSQEGTIVGYQFGTVATQFSVAMAAAVVDITNKKYQLVMWDSEELDSYIQTLKINGHEYNGGGSSIANVNLKTINGQDIVGEGDITISSGEPDVYLKSADYTSNVLTITDNKNATTKVTIPTVNYPVSDVQVNGTSVLNSKIAKIDLTPYQKTIDANNKISADFITTSTAKEFVSTTEKTTWNGKQAAITASNKLDPILINTGDTAMFVTSTEKSTWSGKQNAITSSNKLDAALINTGATARFVTDTEKTTWNGKQAALVSGTNIKTINGESLLGSGDIEIKLDGNGYVTTAKFEELVAQTATDIKFNDDGNLVLMHDSTQITKQTPLSLGEIKGPITVVEISAPAEAVNGSITSDQLTTLQKSNMNMVMFNHEVFTLMDKGHTEGFLTYSHLGTENNITYAKTFTITVSTLTWVLITTPIPKMEYDESTKTLNIVV